MTAPVLQQVVMYFYSILNFNTSNRFTAGLLQALSPQIINEVYNLKLATGAVFSAIFKVGECECDMACS